MIAACEGGRGRKGRRKGQEGETESECRSSHGWVRTGATMLLLALGSITYRPGKKKKKKDSGKYVKRKEENKEDEGGGKRNVIK